MTDTVVTPPAETGQRMIRRHSIVVRITHWVNVVCILFLLMSGLQIFNAHPHLYWGETSTFDQNDQSVDTVLSIGAIRGPDGEPQGVMRLFGGDLIDTDGFLGASTFEGEKQIRAFPAWLTLPSWRDLAAGRLWHFFFAWVFVINGLVYLVYGLAGRHFWRDLIPSRDQWRGFFHTTWDHLGFRFPRGEEAARYNILQKLAYLVVILALIVMVMTGLSMSPGMNAGYPWLADIFGGRQGARTWHFISALTIVLFVLVHVLMVLISGVWNNIRSMITGRYAIKEPVADAHSPLGDFVAMVVTALLGTLLVTWSPGWSIDIGTDIRVPIVIVVGGLLIALAATLAVLRFAKRGRNRGETRA